MKNQHISEILSVWETDNKIYKPLKKELYLEMIDEIASLFAIGNYYYYILNFENLEMEFVHDGIRQVLGILPQQFSLDTLFEVMHPDDLAQMHRKEQLATTFLLKNISTEDISLYKVVYLMRLHHSDGSYKTILHQTKALQVSNDGKVQRVIGVHTDVSYLKLPYNHCISFISDQRPTYYCLNTGNDYHVAKKDFKRLITAREREIISKLAEGESPADISDSLCIAVNTVNTHKRNLFKKLACKNTPELLAKCIMEGII